MFLNYLYVVMIKDCIDGSIDETWYSSDCPDAESAKAEYLSKYPSFFNDSSVLRFAGIRSFD